MKGADVTEPASERDKIAHAFGILRTDEYLAFPSEYEIDEWFMMDEFTRSVVDRHLRAIFGDTIRGQGATRRFKDVLQANGRAEAWYRFRGTLPMGRWRTSGWINNKSHIWMTHTHL